MTNTSYQRRVKNANDRIVNAASTPSPEDAQINATMAVAEATLALAEQQRLGNLLALTTSRHGGVLWRAAAKALLDGDDVDGVSIRPEVREALGLA